jgi:bifunctional DNA-binding transcriptional regulator/antitoxin component of YhaV-PrlF toxin-antitoxin module
MKTKTYSYRGRIYSEIPKEIADILTIKSGDEIEFKPVYENLVLIAPSSQARGKRAKTGAGPRAREKKDRTAQESEFDKVL